MSSLRFRYASVGVLLYTLGVIVWGAYVRATGSGAGCGSHWPVCNGEVIPRAPSVATLIEYSHRLTSGLSLVFVVLLAIWAFRTHPRAHAVRRAAAASVVLMLVEAGLGAGLVLLELVALDASVRRALAMSLHLMNTFFLLGAMGACVFHAWCGDGRVLWRGPSATLLRAAQGTLLLVGASGSVAALGDTLTQHGVATPLVAVLMQLRISHPILAVLGVTVTAFAASVALRTRPHVLPPVRVLAVFLAGQLSVGILNVALSAPVWIQLVHLLLADAVWLALVWVARATLVNASPATSTEPAPPFVANANANANA